MKRETGESSEKKQTSIGRDEFRKQQDIERERIRKELQERGSSKSAKTIKWLAIGLIGISAILAVIKPATMPLWYFFIAVVLPIIYESIRNLLAKLKT